MKYLSFKIIAVCVLLPPLVYILTLGYLEQRLQATYRSEIENSFIGDIQPLLGGSQRLEERINSNINAYLGRKQLLNYGLKVNVIVTTEQGMILYPAVAGEPDPTSDITNAEAIARENYRLLQDGLVIDVNLAIRHNTLLSNAILTLLVLISLSALYLHYRTGYRKSRQEEISTAENIKRLAKLEQETSGKLTLIEKERENLKQVLETIQSDLKEEREKTSINEDAMIDEMVALEQKLEKNVALQSEQEATIAELKQQVEKYEKLERKTGKQKQRSREHVAKRFRTLYKNLEFSDRALAGFVDLSEDMKLKVEEVIHQLNADSSVVPVKRKLFTKRTRETVLEVLYGYKGRLYFRNPNGTRIEILVIGTKNTQNRDLEFIEGL